MTFPAFDTHFQSDRGIAVTKMAQQIISQPLRHMGKMVLRMMIEQLGVSLVGWRVCSRAGRFPVSRMRFGSTILPFAATEISLRIGRTRCGTRESRAASHYPAAACTADVLADRYWVRDCLKNR